MIKAPSKELIWFDQSAHLPNSEERDLFNQVMVAKVLPVAGRGLSARSWRAHRKLSGQIMVRHMCARRGAVKAGAFGRLAEGPSHHILGPVTRQSRPVARAHAAPQAARCPVSPMPAVAYRAARLTGDTRERDAHRICAASRNNGAGAAPKRLICVR